LGDLINPILYKDLLTVGANPAGAGARLLVYAILFALPLLGLAWAATFAHGPWRFAGRPVLLGFCALLGFFHISVAIPAATAFALERDRNTLESLVISPLSPWRLVLGKLLTALSVGVMVKAAVLPALGVAFVLGGADLGFVPRYLLLLLAVDTSLAAFALHLGARRREINTKVGWIKAQTSQTQLVMQATVGMSVLTSLVPIYAAIFLIPLALQHGVHLPEILGDLAPLGVLHPLAALLFWGDADLLGFRVPVWLCGVIFHLLLALPLLADSAEAQKTAGSEPGRLPRLLVLPILAFGLLIVTSFAIKLDGPARVVIASLVPALCVLGAASRASFSKSPVQRISPARIARGLLPTRAFESAPERAVGFVLVVVALAAPTLLWAGGAGPSSVSALAGLALVGLSIAALGARATAHSLDREDAAFVEALEQRSAQDEAGADASAENDDDKPNDKTPHRPKRPLLYLLFTSLALTGVGFLALLLGRHGSVPALESLAPAFTALVGLGLALNPLSALLPILTDPNALGTDAFALWMLAWDLSPNVIFTIHIGLYSLLGALAVLTLKKPIDLDAIMAARAEADLRGGQPLDDEIDDAGDVGR
jgi:hypothetical protein